MSSLNLIFTACVAFKIEVPDRQKINFTPLGFSNLIFSKIKCIISLSNPFQWGLRHRVIIQIYIETKPNVIVVPLSVAKLEGGACPFTAISTYDVGWVELGLGGFHLYLFPFNLHLSLVSLLYTLQSCRWVFKSGWASSNVVGIIFPPVCNRVN